MPDWYISTHESDRSWVELFLRDLHFMKAQ